LIDTTDCRLLCLLVRGTCVVRVVNVWQWVSDYTDKLL